MQINEDFFSGLDNFLEGFMGKASKKNAQSQQSSTWGWSDQKNFSHGWFVGFLQGACHTYFMQTFDREPDVEEEAKLIDVVRKQRFKIKEMMDREFDLAIIEK
jgi:hypothetical protein